MSAFWAGFAWTMVAVDVACAVVMGRWLLVDLRGQRREMRARWDRVGREIDERRALAEEITRRLRQFLLVRQTVRVRRYDAEGTLVSDSHVGDDEA